MFVLLDHKWNVKASQCVCFTSSQARCWSVPVCVMLNVSPLHWQGVEVSQCVSCWMFHLFTGKVLKCPSVCHAECFTSSPARCWSVPVCVMLNVSPLHRQGVEMSQYLSCWMFRLFIGKVLICPSVCHAECLFHLFTGKVLKCPNVRRATVMFTDGEREVLTRFILPVSGAVACPPLSVSVELICPVPHLLCPVPPSRTPHQTPTFSVLHPHPTPTSSVLYPHHTPHIWLPSSLSYTPITPTTSHPPPPLSYTPLSVSVELISPVPLLCSITTIPPPNPSFLHPTLSKCWADFSCPPPLFYTTIPPPNPSFLHPHHPHPSSILSCCLQLSLPPPPPKPCS